MIALSPVIADLIPALAGAAVSAAGLVYYVVEKRKGASRQSSAVRAAALAGGTVRSQTDVPTEPFTPFGHDIHVDNIVVYGHRGMMAGGGAISDITGGKGASIVAGVAAEQYRMAADAVTDVKDPSASLDKRR